MMMDAGAVPPALFVMEMHDYQEEFVALKREQHGMGDSGEVVRALLDYAAANEAEWAAIFRTGHWHRCDTDDGLKVNAWKKSKKPVSFGLPPQQMAYLAMGLADPSPPRSARPLPAAQPPRSFFFFY